ncbi:Vesicle-associated membrane protein 3-like isoform X2 [Aix galericulata]|nr:Vesicle-associated membrane protein 3-like isoform X2 [Aix galericulata]
MPEFAAAALHEIPFQCVQRELHPATVTRGDNSDLEREREAKQQQALINSSRSEVVSCPWKPRRKHMESVYQVTSPCKTELSGIEQKALSARRGQLGNAILTCSLKKKCEMQQCSRSANSSFIAGSRSAPAPPTQGATSAGAVGPPPANVASSKRLQQTQARVDEVVDIMRMNVDKVLERDQKLSELDNRADALQAGASQFETSAAKLKRKYWWKNCKSISASSTAYDQSSRRCSRPNKQWQP